MCFSAKPKQNGNFGDPLAGSGRVPKFVSDWREKELSVTDKS